MQDAVLISTLFSLIGFLSPCVAAEAGDPNQQSTINNQQSTSIVKSIEFKGNRKYKDHVLRERLGFELGDRLDPFLAEGGRVTISEVYRKIGYPFVKVSLDKERLADGHLLYIIDEGPRVRIDKIDFVGNDSFGDGTLRQVIKTKQRKLLLWPSHFTEDAIDEDLDRLRDFYYNHGFLDYHISAEKEFTIDGSGVQLVFTIDEGPVYRVGEILFVGNTRYTDEQLRERMELREEQVYLKPVARARRPDDRSTVPRAGFRGRRRRADAPLYHAGGGQPGHRGVRRHRGQAVPHRPDRGDGQRDDEGQSGPAGARRVRVHPRRPV